MQMVEGEKMRLIDVDVLIRRIIKRLVSWYYKRTGFLAYSWSIDEHTEITILSAEYTSNGYRVGTGKVKYETN